MYINVSCIYLRILVSNTISISNGVHAYLALTLLVSLVEQELLTLPEQMSSPVVFIYFCCHYVISKKPKCGIETAFLYRTPPVCLGVLVLQSVVFCIVIVDHCMSCFLWSLYCLSLDSLLLLWYLLSGRLFFV